MSCQACREQEQAGDGQPPCRAGQGCETNERWLALTPRARLAWQLRQDVLAAKNLGLLPPGRRPLTRQEAQAVWQLLVALDQALTKDEQARQARAMAGRQRG